MNWKNKIPIAGGLLLLPLIEIVRHLNDAGLVVVGGGVALVAGIGYEKGVSAMPETYDQWIRQVDALCARKYFGITTDDLPDQDWAGLFEDGYSPEEALDHVIAEEL